MSLNKRRQQMTTFKNKIQDIVVFLVFAALLIVGTKFDFRFSDKIYSNNWFNFFVAAIAKMPVLFLTIYACVNLFIMSMKKENKAEKYIMAFVYALGALVAGALMFEDMAEVFVDGILKYVIAAAVGCLVIAYLWYVLKDQTEKQIENKKEFLVLIISVAIIVVLTFAIKSIIDRTRFIDILQRKGTFTQWYQIGTGGDSMPSGHTAMAVALFAAIPYFKKINLFRGKDFLYYPVIGIYTLLIGFSRISFGMHFLSDVAVAAIVGYCVSKVVTWIMLGFKEDKLEIKEGSFLAKL